MLLVIGGLWKFSLFSVVGYLTLMFDKRKTLVEVFYKGFLVPRAGVEPAQG